MKQNEGPPKSSENVVEHRLPRALRQFKSYPVYKDSGVQWLGEIPNHWSVLSLKRITHIRYGLGEPPQLLPNGLPFVRATNVTRGRIVDRDMQFVDPKDVPWNRDPTLRTGDIIVVRSGAYTGDSAIIPKLYDGAIAGYDMVVRQRRGEPQFLAWVLLSQYVLDAQIKLESNRAAQPHLNAEELGSVSILLPSDSEQRAIAAFLDRETARIDGLVAKKERLIELLQEKRAALITRAVTKGLDPNVPMKDSGVEWLGEIPTHWSVKPFTKCVVDKTDYRGRTPEKVASGVFLVTARNVRMGQIDYDCSQEFIAESDYDRVMRRGIPKNGDILFTTEAPLGNVALVDRKDIALAQRIIRFRMNPAYFDNRFTLLAMMSGYFQAQLATLSTGSTAEGLKASKLTMLWLVAPPLEEQKSLADVLDRELVKFNALVRSTEEAIGYLRELRTALISAAVTGKIDVREEVA